jgi:hypothetical protein
MMVSSEWKDKSAVISDTAAWKEYGVNQDFLNWGIQNGRLDFKQGTIKGRPYIRVLRNQLERLIGETPEGSAHLVKIKAKAELKRLQREIAYLSDKLAALMSEKARIEASGLL